MNTQIKEIEQNENGNHINEESQIEKQDKYGERERKEDRKNKKSSKRDKDEKKDKDEKRKKDDVKEKDDKKKKDKDKDKDKKKKRSKSRSRHKSKKSKRSYSRSSSRSQQKHKKSRKRKSRSRSRTKSKSRSYNSKRSYKFDSPPKEPTQNILSSNLTGQTLNAVSQTLNMSSLNNLSPNVLQSLGPANLDQSQLMNKIQIMQAIQQLQNSKYDRKLYIGNLPQNITTQTLCDVLNSALQKMGVNTNPPGNSIESSWISPDGHYAFVDFRTAEEATNGFALNNVAIFGQPLKVGRPKTYAAQQATMQALQQNLNNPNASFAQIMMGQNPMMAGMMPGGIIPGLLPTLQIPTLVNPMNPLQAPLIGGGLASLGLGVNPLLTPTQSATMTPQQPELQPQGQMQIAVQSRILVLKNMVQRIELEIDEEYEEIKQDVTEECQRYGKVISIKIPRPIQGQDIKGLGKIFVEYNTIEEAKDARKNLQGRTFSNNTVECSYFNEEDYKYNNLY